MLRQVEKCCFTEAGKPDVCSIYEKNGKTVLKKGREKQKLDIKVIQTLDIFFKEAELEQAQDEAQGAVSVRFRDDKELYYTGDKNVVQQLSEYFNAYFEGTANPFTLRFHSFDGGGPKYSVEMEKTGIFTWYGQRRYNNPDHDKMCGSAFDVIFDFYPLRKGTATALIRGDSPICPEPVRRLYVEVGDGLSMTYKIEEIE